MPHDLECPRCGRIGLVRAEQVITGSVTTHAYYCGGCDYSWQGPERLRVTPVKVMLRPKPDRRLQDRRKRPRG